jgi:hypothetical protein
MEMRISHLLLKNILISGMTEEKRAGDWPEIAADI